MMHDAALTVLFYAFGAFAILCALAVVNARRLLRAALALMFVLLASAGLYLLLGAEFLAGIQVLVYVGGIVILIVFAVMLTSASDLLEDHPSLGRMLAGAVASIGFLAFTGVVFARLELGPPAPGAHPPDDASAIGRKLLDFGAEGYVLPFELVSLLLLAAVIGGIVVARKTPPRHQPFTSGGDAPGEADIAMPRSQRDEPEGPHA
ncbi:MAG TPA: NADH-quinone oxidoreductase subunit J [Planctomycetes bacterium]|nr:NADH-quinone oxidoreductase subunit J [Planctomycetota bacterium]